MPKAGSTPSPSHLLAGLVSVLIVTAVVTAVPLVLARMGNQALSSLLVGPATQKDMGTLLQGLGVTDPSLLPLYGSSELTWKIPNRADRFFAGSPTGFQICPIGGPGNTTMMMAQKIAAQGALMHDRKIVVLLSCSWFRRPALPGPDYAGNFSPAQAINILLDTDLDRNVRRRIARVMLDYPDTLKEYPALAICTHALVANDPISHWSGVIQRPLLRLQQAAMEMEDHLGTLLSLLNRNQPDKSAPEAAIPVATSLPFSWDKVIGRAQEFAAEEDPASLVQSRPPGAQDASFIAAFDGSREWADFEVLLDTCKSLKVRPLVVAIPLDGPYETAHGVSRSGRDYYYNRLGDACASRGISFTHLDDHDLDTGFVIHHSSHLSGKGWIFLNRVLDDFYHDQLPAAAAGVTHS
ncbi:MAG: D-alanyl-lipoteichoic acid biosynthesis protein DltD [Verrucomicrobiaceae bacterium]|nr:D-alanyl-lipoteichoic acid biosynthesis protein DltD [Verrucomicrobiaceae bacterium]